MINCSNCGHGNLEGALFCDQCGVAMGMLSLGTKQLGDDSDDLQAGSEKLSTENIIFLYVPSYEDPITVQVHDKIVLGRLGGEDNVIPHVNLNPYGAEDGGVSRRHAILLREGSRLHISDLGSTNATYLNGQRVTQDEHLVVRDGDEVRLGHLSMRLFFK